MRMNLDNVIERAFSGVISITQEENVIFEGKYGFADRANEIPNRMNTRFGTASAGKVFVATAILSFIEKGILHFDTSIGNILKFDLKQIDPEITIKQLLNHTSGIPDYFDESIMDDYEELWINIPNYRMRRILLSAREKVADSLINGKMIRIEGGNFTRNICPIKCLDCGKEWKESFENLDVIKKGQYACPDCRSIKIVCEDNCKGKFCHKNCWRHGKMDY